MAKFINYQVGTVQGAAEKLLSDANFSVLDGYGPIHTAMKWPCLKGDKEGVEPRKQYESFPADVKSSVTWEYTEEGLPFSASTSGRTASSCARTSTSSRPSTGRRPPTWRSWPWALGSLASTFARRGCCSRTHSMP